MEVPAAWYLYIISLSLLLCLPDNFVAKLNPCLAKSAGGG